MNYTKLAHDAAYSDSNDLAVRTVWDKILRECLWNCYRSINLMDIKND